ncbi:cAMP-binding domain of CRP or a regulatory subunit of cAMP-dependent protein kinases [Roseomonas rosea]|uniref:cAMP-binding domain of CRP or a regulatory subunit of cAMP-dependent protein kinases n=1 Tax=Muricoccus roseus TaxID=198092 RepID=A0A1M6D6Q0_9PROT|nr:Crp/Fnr family transcriptional regulator [Roseomonas rosea]SHI68880.1 cAMP-binding domain of CRP or a regulatory subunit of cAMP-dependent protein kinases [Roseomonas rosea]
MTSHLIRKLEQFTKLSSKDKHVLDQVSTEGLRQLGAREDIIREGERPQAVNLILSGWACRYKYLEDGRRQIIAFFLPGDLCDNHVFVLREMDHSIGTLTPVTIAQIPRQRIEEVSLHHSRITQALWWESLVNMAIQREWTVSLGQRDASERLAHLLCELFLRLRGVGLTDGDSCELPVKQAELADALGLSTVHVNRTLQELRAAKLIVLKGKMLTIPNLEALQDVAQFSPNYLHLDREGRHLDAND